MSDISEIKILQPSDQAAILQFERARLPATPDSFMSEWHAPWRTEALEHYLPLGWSFGLFSKAAGTLTAYFLAQPQLFINGMTQSLWLEHVSFQNENEARRLMEVAYRLSREKHFQVLLFTEGQWQRHLPPGVEGQPWPQNLVAVRTARFE
jgi:hypothetical protein